ncbi:MAG: MotA/TolQ/ExbB proton channel family protein [Lentisphaerae bacterium]|nr:MotA/TolQ/ExbB proton channel family protein [Lentisphaerota bacterium]
MMNQATRMIMNFLIQQQALDAAATGNMVGMVVAAVYVCLLLASIVGLAVILERAVRLRHKRLIDPELATSLRDPVDSGDFAAATNLCVASKSVLGEVLGTELEEYTSGRVTMQDAIEDAEERVDDKLNANLDILATVAKIAPLLGLLGTVLGMMHAFGQLDIGTRKETLAQGITAALDTTVRGLVIAITCLTFERYFQRRIGRAAREFDAVFKRLVRAARKGTREGNEAPS